MLHRNWKWLRVARSPLRNNLCVVHVMFTAFSSFTLTGIFIRSALLFFLCCFFLNWKLNRESLCTRISKMHEVCVHFAFEIMNECSILIYHYGACFESKLFVFDFFSLFCFESIKISDVFTVVFLFFVWRLCRWFFVYFVIISEYSRSGAWVYKQLDATLAQCILNNDEFNSLFYSLEVSVFVFIYSAHALAIRCRLSM